MSSSARQFYDWCEEKHIGLNDSRRALLAEAWDAAQDAVFEAPPGECVRCGRTAAEHSYQGRTDLDHAYTRVTFGGE